MLTQMNECNLTRNTPCNHHLVLEVLLQLRDRGFPVSTGLLTAPGSDIEEQAAWLPDKLNVQKRTLTRAEVVARGCATNNTRRDIGHDVLITTLHTWPGVHTPCREHMSW